MTYTPTMRLLVTTDPSHADFPIFVTLDPERATLPAQQVTDPLLADATVIIVEAHEDSVETVYWTT